MPTGDIYPQQVPQGWVCPKCGTVHAPWVARCNNCTPQTIPPLPQWPVQPITPHPMFPPQPINPIGPIICKSENNPTC